MKVTVVLTNVWFCCQLSAKEVARRHKAAVQTTNKSASSDTAHVGSGDAEEMDVDDGAAQTERAADNMTEQEKPEADREQQAGEDGEILTDDDEKVNILIMKMPCLPKYLGKGWNITQIILDVWSKVHIQKWNGL